MRRIVLDIKGTLLAEALVQALTTSNSDFIIYRSLKREETITLCKTCKANVLVMQVNNQEGLGIEERLKIRDEIKALGLDLRIALLVDESEDTQLAARVRQAVKDQLVDSFVYTSVSPTYLAAVIDTL